MDIFGKKFDTLHELFLYELQSVYDAEQQILEALPKMYESAGEPDLKRALEQHVEVTNRQVARLEDIFDLLDVDPERVRCDAMSGMIKDATRIATSGGSPEVRDVGIIGAAQKVEHYEIACYGTLRAWAEEMGHQDVAAILKETLGEKRAIDTELSGIATSQVNIKAPGM